jgi:hypothetical protein
MQREGWCLVGRIHGSQAVLQVVGMKCQDNTLAGGGNFGHAVPVGECG